MPKVQALHERFKDKGVVVFGVNTWEEEGDPVAFMKGKDLTYGLLLKGDEVAAAYKVTGIPTFYVIGKDGKILHTAVGIAPGEDERIAEVIEGHLAGK
jgi:hypothetical protein